jgi:cellulose synthase/poly-beta-1,6-N-acetylglucosamine synthase-like glycosyltransferase
MNLFEWLASTWDFFNRTWLFWLGLGVLLAAGRNLLAWRGDRLFALDYARRSQESLHLDTIRPVSLLVAAWNEAGHIRQFIASFRALRYPLKHLVLVAGGADGTYELAHSLAGADVTVIEQQPGEGKQRALRCGLEHAAGEVIFLTDADSLLQDESFERTLQPVVSGEEEVCTGASHASLEQMRSIFIASQSVTMIYAQLHAARYATGIFGRNCAVTRAALERSRGLDQPAPTGTDYVLAKTLAGAGYRIRQQPLSRLISAAPRGLRAYLRQQRRWLYNVYVYGRRFGYLSEARRALSTSLVGLGMLVLPWAAFLAGPAVLALWAGLYALAVGSRLRYLGFCRLAIGLRLSPGLAFFQAVMPLVDFVAWAGPLGDYLRPRRERSW